MTDVPRQQVVVFRELPADQLARLQAWRSVHAMVARHIRDERLRQAFSFHTLLVGGNPFSTSAIYALIHALERKGGVWFAKGGTGTLVAGMVRHFQRLGGTLRLESTDGAGTTLTAELPCVS